METESDLGLAKIADLTVDATLEKMKSPLEILPLKTVPTLEYLKGQDLAELRKGARKPDGLAEIPVGEFFGPQVSGGVHFLVWLPPRDREFLWSVLFHD
jgi:hypothetical protein